MNYPNTDKVRVSDRANRGLGGAPCSRTRGHDASLYWNQQHPGMETEEKRSIHARQSGSTYRGSMNHGDIFQGSYPRGMDSSGITTCADTVQLAESNASLHVTYLGADASSASLGQSMQDSGTGGMADRSYSSRQPRSRRTPARNPSEMSSNSYAASVSSHAASITSFLDFDPTADIQPFPEPKDEEEEEDEDWHGRRADRNRRLSPIGFQDNDFGDESRRWDDVGNPAPPRARLAGHSPHAYDSRRRTSHHHDAHEDEYHGRALASSDEYYLEERRQRQLRRQQRRQQRHGRQHSRSPPQEHFDDGNDGNRWSSGSRGEGRARPREEEFDGYIERIWSEQDGSYIERVYFYRQDSPQQQRPPPRDRSGRSREGRSPRHQGDSYKRSSLEEAIQGSRRRHTTGSMSSVSREEDQSRRRQSEPIPGYGIVADETSQDRPKERESTTPRPPIGSKDREDSVSPGAFPRKSLRKAWLKDYVCNSYESSNSSGSSGSKPGAYFERHALSEDKVKAKATRFMIEDNDGSVSPEQLPPCMPMPDGGAHDVRGVGGFGSFGDDEPSPLVSSSSPPMSTSRSRPCGPEDDIYLEVFPGMQERLRRTKETKDAIERDFYTPGTCCACNMDLFCIADVAYFICPTCKTINPFQNNDGGSDVGIAFGYETLFKIQSEILRDRQQQQR